MLLTDTMKSSSPKLGLVLLLLYFNSISAIAKCKNNNGKQCDLNLEGLVKSVAILKMKDRIKQQILGQLGLPSRPKPTEVTSTHPDRERRDGATQSQINFTVTPTIIKPNVSEFLIVSQRPENLKDANIIMFQPNFVFQNSSASENMVVKSANLLIRLKRKRRPQTQTKTASNHQRTKSGRYKRHKVLSLTVSTVTASGKPDKQIATVKTRVGKSKWFNVSLPSSLIQNIIDQSQSSLLLHVKCRRCRKNAEVILVRGTRRARRHVSKMSKKGKLKIPRRRRSKVNKSRPILIVEVITEHKSRYQRSVRNNGYSRNGHHRNQIGNRRNSRRKKGQNHAPLCSASTTGCCRESFYFSFAEVGMGDWIISPLGFYTSECLGNCGLNVTNFNAIASQSSEQSCQPFHSLPLGILYFSESLEVKYSLLTDVVVTDCRCNL